MKPNLKKILIIAAVLIAILLIWLLFFHKKEVEAYKDILI